MKHIDEERAENARVRDFTLQAFKDLGYEGVDAHTNCIFVDLKRPAKEFRDACEALKVRGRPRLPAVREDATAGSRSARWRRCGRPWACSARC